MDYAQETPFIKDSSLNNSNTRKYPHCNKCSVYKDFVLDQGMPCHQCSHDPIAYMGDCLLARCLEILEERKR